MEINFPKIHGAYDYKKIEKRSAVEKAARTDTQTDKVALSSQAKDFQSVMKALGTTPDIREDVVKSIRDRIDAGEYNVSSKDVAAKIMSRAY